MILLQSVFFLIVGAICLLPYDDTELRAFIFPDDCRQPCVMGVEIGKSTTREAAAILEQHPWVASVDVGSYVVTWRWNNSAPAYMDTQSAGWIRVVYGGSTVNSAYIRTRVNTGRLLLMLGQPTEGYISPTVMGWYDVGAIFPEQNIQLTERGVLVCPVTAANLHFTHTEVSWITDTVEQPDAQPWPGLLPHTAC